MDLLERTGFIVGPEDLILITGATGFIGSKIVERLLKRGFRNLRCFARPSSDATKLQRLAENSGSAQIQVVRGNLLSRDDCANATRDVKLIFHLAAARGE